MKRRHVHVVPDPAPGQTTLAFAALCPHERGQEAEPVDATADFDLERDLARIAARLRAKGGS